MDWVIKVTHSDDSVEYIACLDSTEVTIPIERHARRFSSPRAIREYEEMVRAGRARFKLRNGTEFVPVTATDLFS